MKKGMDFWVKKETVIRQNRCDGEMNFLFYVVYFVFMATQIFIGGSDHEKVINIINMLLYMVFVPGFMFCAGYRYGRIVQSDSEEHGKRQLLLDAGKYFIYYFVLSVIYGYIHQRLPFRHLITNTLTAVEIPPISAIFFSLAVMSLLVRIFYGSLRRLTANHQYMLLVGVVCLLSVFLRSEGECYTVVASLFGSDMMPVPSCIPYMIFFLMGIFFWEEKPGFQWRIACVMAVLTGISLILYGSPLQDLCRVTASFLPVYLIYVTSELLSDLSLRLKTVRIVCGMIEPVFYIYSLFLFALAFSGMMAGAGIVKTVLTAVGTVVLIYAVIAGFSWFSFGYSVVMNYMNQKIRHKTVVYFVLYTVVFAFLMLALFSSYVISGRTLIWNGDGVAQYYPRAVYFSEYIRNFICSILKGKPEFIMYDFRLGLGDGVVLSLEPLYFLYAAFGEDHIELAYNLLTILRFYLAGVSASVLFLYYKKDYFTTFLSSVVYVFCGFSMFAGTRHPSCMIPMILFPLMIISLEEILKNRRWYLMTIVTAISLLSNYYFLYMSTIGTGVFFLVRFFCQSSKEEKTLKNFMKKGCTIAGSYLLGVGMSCIVLVTTFGMYISSGRNGDITIQTPDLFYYGKDWLVRCFQTFITPVNSPGMWMKLGFLPISLLAVVILFMNKGRKELKILSAIAMVFTVFPVFGFIFSGFSSVVNRWCYMIALLVAYIVADCLPDLLQMKKKDFIACGIVITIYGYLAFFGNVILSKYVKLSFLFLVLTFGLVLLTQKQVKRFARSEKQGILFALTASLIFCQGYLYYSTDGEVNVFAKTGKTEEKIESTPLTAVKELDDDTFYRVAEPRLDYSTICSSQVFDYNSIYTFSSVINSNIIEYLRELGCITCTSTQLMGFGNSTFMNALAAVKYYAFYGETPKGKPLVYGCETVKETEKNSQKITIAENKYALPIGYTYKEAISEEELNEYGVLERQEVMLQKAVLNDSENTGSMDALVTAEKLDITSVEEDGIEWKDHAIVAGDTEGTGTEESTYEMKIHFNGKPDSETWLVLKNASLDAENGTERVNMSVFSKNNSFSYKFPSSLYRYGTGQKDFVMNLGYHEEAINTCRIKLSSACTIRFESFEIYSQPMDHVKQYTDTLKEDVLENVQMGTNSVSGTISLEEDKILVLSIPYQKGWTAYVDGEKTELQRANYMYMALPLETGDHEIELRYKIPYIEAAMIIMAGSVVLFVMLLIMGGIRKKIKQRKNRE